MAGVKGRSGGRRAGAGRPRGPDVLRELGRIRGALEVQNVILTRLHQQRQYAMEHGPLILRRLTEIERVLHQDRDMHWPPRASRRRPLGI